MEGFREEVSLELPLNRKAGVFQSERRKRLSQEQHGRAWHFLGSETGLGGSDVGGGVGGQS